MHQSHPSSREGERTPGVDFLLAEYTSARDLITYYGNRGDKRVDVLLTVTTAFIAGVALFSQTHTQPRAIVVLSMLTSLVLIGVALRTFIEVRRADLAVIERGMAMRCIRDYFAKRYPEILPALVTSQYLRADGTIIGVYGHWRIPMAINALGTGAFVTSLWLLFGDYSALDIGALLAGGIVATLLLGAGEILSRRMDTRMEYVVGGHKLTDHAATSAVVRQSAHAE